MPLTPVAFALTLSLAALGADDAPEPSLNEKVVAFARENLGRKVGNGECTSLAVAALRSAGARATPLNPGRSGDFVWGRPVASFRDARAGDVVQFRDAVFQGRRWVTKRRWVSWRQTYPHHTAIVADVRERGAAVVVLHQNVGPDGTPEDERRSVTESTIRPGSLQKGGTVWIYRPVPPNEPLTPDVDAASK